MEYNLSETKRYSVDCEGCKATTGNYANPETVQKMAAGKGFIAIATAEDGTINLCVNCIPEDVVQFFRTRDDEPAPIETEVPG